MTILEENTAEALQRTPQRLLVRRFDDVPAQARAQIKAATLEQLDAWLNEMLDADSVEAALKNGSAGSAHWAHGTAHAAVRDRADCPPRRAGADV